jgi:hypothetical protein
MAPDLNEFRPIAHCTIDVHSREAT